ncbi:MAG: hypothetical protein JSW70_07125 [Syntrophobacterales bacterium]|nr:MAG: hypothetical protein JSW70_07125 [Syntrophobacterales bacterium]
MELIETGVKAEDIRINTQCYTEFLDSIIRRYPDQYFWIHRRWERKKKDRTRFRIRRYGKCIRETDDPEGRQICEDLKPIFKWEIGFSTDGSPLGDWAR